MTDQTNDVPLPTFEIAERRAQQGDLSVLREVDPASALRDQRVPMQCRWISTKDNEGRFQQVMNMGYHQVRAVDLAVAPERNGWQKSPEGYVVRGEKGHELLVMMPKALYQQIQINKAQEGDKRRRSAQGMRQQIADELGGPARAQSRGVIQSAGITEFEETADVRKL